MVRKTKFLSILGLVSEIITFLTKKKGLYEFPQKYFKKTARHSLAVCYVWGELFFLYLTPFPGLFKNGCLNKSKFHQNLPFSNMVRNTNFLSISVLVPKVVPFISKKKSTL